MNTLKEVLADAARYRWVRKNLWAIEGIASIPDGGSDGLSGRYMTEEEFDNHVDGELINE